MSQPSSFGSIDASILQFLNGFNKLLSTTNGRDKLAKLLVYGSRIVGHQVDTRLASLDPKTDIEAIKSTKDLSARVVAFEGGVGLGRKVSRFFRFLPGYIALYQYIIKVFFRLQMRNAKPTSTKEHVIEVANIVKGVCMANYFLYDHLNWAAKLKLLSNYSGPKDPVQPTSALSRSLKTTFNNSRALDYNRSSNYSWFYGLLITISVDFSNLYDLFNKETALQTDYLRLLNVYKKEAMADTRGTTSVESEEAITAKKKMDEIDKQLTQLRQKRIDMGLDFIANFCDLGVAMSLLGKINISKGTVGWLGTISGLIGAYKIW